MIDEALKLNITNQNISKGLKSFRCKLIFIEYLFKRNLNVNPNCFKIAMNFHWSFN